MSEDGIVGIDLFAGAGGMTLGATEAGVKVIHAIEICRHAAHAYRLNFPTIPLEVVDIRDVQSLPDKPTGVRSILFGGPPCCGFSTSNQRTRNSTNASNWLFKEFGRLTCLWEPDWIVLENVTGIAKTSGGRFLAHAIDMFKQAGYTTTHFTLNAVDFGAPQRRERMFVIGARDGTTYNPPQPSAARQGTVGEAIGDLPPLKNGAHEDILPYGNRKPSEYAATLRRGAQRVTGNLVTRNAEHILKRYAHVPPGGNWANIPKRLLANYSNVERCHTGIYRRLDVATPSVVIGNFRKNMLIHPSEDRGLSVREAARIQGLPDWFRFSGSVGFQQQQVGNALPPPLARALIKEVVRG